MSLTAGRYHTCGRTSTGAAYCWGDNGSGQLGDGTQTQRLTPVAVQGGIGWTALSAGSTHTCGLKDGGATYCWGGLALWPNEPGAPPRLAPSRVEGVPALRDLDSGTYHSCGLTSADVGYCWGGSNGWGYLGNGSRDGAPGPVIVHNGFPFSQLAAGVWHGCGLTRAGDAYCWGFNEVGQLGSGDPQLYSREALGPVYGGQSFTHLISGYDHVCGLTSDGAAFCWGWNAGGQLGDGTITSRFAPVAVQGGHLFTTLTAGVYHTCGVSRSGVAYCWGENRNGEVGDGTNVPRLVPVAVLRR